MIYFFPCLQKVSPLLLNFVSEMRDPATGISIKDRSQRISSNQYTTFHRCFQGKASTTVPSSLQYSFSLFASIYFIQMYWYEILIPFRLLGKDMVDWLMEKMHFAEREHAVKIGQKLLTADVIHHVRYLTSIDATIIYNLSIYLFINHSIMQ